MSEKKPLIGYAIIEDYSEDFSNWFGQIAFPDPTGANLYWQNPTKFIEHSAYDQLQDENAKLKDREQKLLEVISVLKEACGFYGDEFNYSIDDYHGISGEMRKRCVLYKDCEERNDVYSYAGQRARQALAKVDEMLREIGVGK